MDDRKRELEMARRCYGYGRWEAPYWFLGPEQGKGRKEPPDNTRRVEAWFELGATELCDCHDFHSLIGEKDWHREKPNLQRTWRPLILVLKTFLDDLSNDDLSNKECLRNYQRTRWGRADGETCIIELSSLASKSLKGIHR